MAKVFFNGKQKKMSKCSFNELNAMYENSERRLLNAARKGDRKALDKAMAVHHDIEYATLYKHVANAKKK